jgi:hypothetical protein
VERQAVATVSRSPFLYRQRTLVDVAVTVAAQMLGAWLTSFWHSNRHPRGRHAGPDLEPGADMTPTQAVLLALSIAVFVYLGVALFKAEWF